MDTEFKEWFRKQYCPEQAQEISQHGADAGWSGIIYTSECCALYERFESEIFDALSEDADCSGYTIDEFTATFGRADMLEDLDQRKNLLLWYMVEREAHNSEGESWAHEDSENY